MPQIEIPERFNVAEALVNRNIEQGKGDKVAIYFEEQRLTYNDIQTMVNKFGNALRGLGIGMENRVAILLPDCPQWIASFFGAMKIGAVPIPLNTMMRPKDYEYFLNDSRARAIVVSDDLVGNIEEIGDALNYLEHIIVVGRAKEGQLSYDKLLEEVSLVLEVAPTTKDDSAFWCYTSGSTGQPKGTVHLHHDLLVPEPAPKSVFGVTEGDIVYSVGRLFFTYATEVLASTFYVGASQVLTKERPTPETVLQIITKYRPTIIYVVPTLLANILALKDVSRFDLSSIRLCTSAGEPLPAGIFRQFKERFGIEILDGIGSTESLSWYILTRPGRVRIGSTGEAVPGVELKIVDEQGRELPTGEVGELMVKADSNSPYYWNKHDQTKRTMVGEWLRTGDQFYCDEDGYYWFQGRVDDVIKAGGIKVIPTEVEATLIEHPAVIEAAVVGAPDEQGLLKPKAFVVLNKEYKPSPELANELQQFVKAKIAPYNYPRWVEFIGELPKTATGKIQRFKLR